MTRPEPPLYDFTHALSELDRYRATASADGLAERSVAVADDLARNMARHFPEESDRRAAGTALVIAAASIAALRSVPLEVVVNVTGLAGQQLYQDPAVTG